MPGAALVAALGLELEHPQLVAALVRDHLRGDLGVCQAGLVEQSLLVAQHERLQCHALALGHRQTLDDEALTALDAVLLAATLDNCVHIGLAGGRSLVAAGLGLGSGTAPPASATATPRFGL